MKREKNCDTDSKEVFAEKQGNQPITAVVKWGTFFCSIVYAKNDHVPRRKLWHSLEVFSQLVGDASWLLLGDFNDILSTTKCEGGMVGNSPTIMEFQDCMTKIAIMDLHYDGIQFTWAGSPHGVGVVKKLDRALVNPNFLTKFKGAKCTFLNRGTSDHSPILVKFEDVQKWVEKVAGVRMFQIMQKMYNMKPLFRKAAWDSRNLCDTVQGLAESLKQIQFELDAAPFNEHWKLQEAKRLRDYREAALEEDPLVACWSFENQVMVDQFVGFYKKMLGTEAQCKPLANVDDWIRKVPYDKCQQLITEVTDEEIRSAMFGAPLSKFVSSREIAGLGFNRLDTVADCVVGNQGWFLFEGDFLVLQRHYKLGGFFGGWFGGYVEVGGVCEVKWIVLILEDGILATNGHTIETLPPPAKALIVTATSDAMKHVTIQEILDTNVPMGKQNKSLKRFLIQHLTYTRCHFREDASSLRLQDESGLNKTEERVIPKDDKKVEDDNRAPSP
ncbi:hypothetical protein POM88_014711 [Heracleum sosnowskyi]|uniref:Uncharacterized protein n=1 Tax=Heracleum sosnowskyi TaxID=360622 RepID=A0AAD8IKX8_9APIA|nr:hypothetical protein POM88_014711 [Heracleum sosnowskyi]